MNKLFFLIFFIMFFIIGMLARTASFLAFNWSVEANNISDIDARVAANSNSSGSGGVLGTLVGAGEFIAGLF